MTKLGRLVKAGYIKTFEEIYTYSLPIKGKLASLTDRGGHCGPHPPRKERN